jgi:hypothetical protein
VILWFAMDADDSLPDDVTALKAMLRAERAPRLAAEAEAQARTLSTRFEIESSSATRCQVDQFHPTIEIWR